MDGAVPKKKRKSDEVKLSSSQRSMDRRQQQKEQDPEGVGERERLRTRERRQNRQGNQTANQTKCSTNMLSKETQTDITVSVNEILRKLTPLSDSSGRYKLVDQMDGTGNGDLIFEENDIAEQEIPISPPLSVTSLILDVQQDMTKTVPRPYSVESICSEAERPPSKKILVTSNDDTTECTGGDIQLNEGSIGDTVTVSESKMLLETVGNSNEDSTPAGNPNDVNAISKPFDDMETASSPKASIRKSTDPRPEVTKRDNNCNGERSNADGKKDEELKASYEKSGKFTFCSKMSKKTRPVDNILVFRDKLFIRKAGMEYIEEVYADGTVGSPTTFSEFGDDRFVEDVAISQTNGAIWFCCVDNSVKRYLDGKCMVIFRTNYLPRHLYIDSSNFKENVYVSHETGLEIWDEVEKKTTHITLNKPLLDANGEKELFDPSRVDKDAVSGRVLVTSASFGAPMLLDGSLQETTFIGTLPKVCPSIDVYTGCFNHKGNIILGTSRGAYVLSGVNFEVLTILNKEHPTFNMLCFPNHDLWIVCVRDICKYSYTDE